MRILNDPLQQIPWMSRVKSMLRAKCAKAAIYGSSASHELHLMSALSEGEDSVLVLTYSEKRARDIYEEYLFYDRETLLYPAKDLIFYLQILKENMIAIHVGGELEERELAVKLIAMGYEKNYQVEAPGQFSVRGGIVDIFDLTSPNPYRIELWGDTVDSIRSFDVESQRSIETLDTVTVFPASEMILTEEQRYEGFGRIKAEAKEQREKLRAAMQTEEAHRIKMQLDELENQLIHGNGMLNLESYLHYFYPKEETTTFLKLFGEKRPLVFLDEPSRLMEHVRGVEAEFRESMIHRLEKGYVLPGQTTLLRNSEEALAEVSEGRSVQLAAMEPAERFFNGEECFTIQARTLASYNNSFSALVSNLKELKKDKYKIVILCASRTGGSGGFLYRGCGEDPAARGDRDLLRAHPQRFLLSGCETHGDRRDGYLRSRAEDTQQKDAEVYRRQEDPGLCGTACRGLCDP